MKKNRKFIIGISVIVIAIIYLAVTGFQQDYAFYMTVDEFLAKLPEFNEQAYEKKFKVAGQVVMGSIDRSTDPMKFEIHYNNLTLPVRYIGLGPVPDTFKDHAETVLDGKYSTEGIFMAENIQAKCASKYEAMMEEGISK